MIESGYKRYLMLPKSFSEQLPLRGSLNSDGHLSTLFNGTPFWVGTLDGVLNPVIDFTDLTTEPNLGQGFLRQYVVPFEDYWDQEIPSVRWVRAVYRKIA